jgi:hypothetical protein
VLEQLQDSRLSTPQVSALVDQLVQSVTISR